MNKKFTLYIIGHNRVDLIQDRINDLKKHMDYDDLNVRWVDNASPDNGITDLVDVQFEESQIDWKAVIRTNGLVGFGAAFNKAIAITDTGQDDIIILMSDDVIIKGNFLENPGFLISQCEQGTLLCHQIIDWQAGWNQFGQILIDYAAGYFLMLSRRLWNQLGGFDERYDPYDYEDVDLSMKVCRGEGSHLPHGGRILQHNFPVHHIGAQSIGFTDARREITVRNRALFAEKWDLPNFPERP